MEPAGAPARERDASKPGRGTLRGYALAANVQRRSLTSSQKYLIMEQARRLNGAKKVTIVTSDGERRGLSDAATVLDHAPDLAVDVAAGVVPLYEAVVLVVLYGAVPERARVGAWPGVM
jgi:hypothetical protein